MVIFCSPIYANERKQHSDVLKITLNCFPTYTKTYLRRLINSTWRVQTPVTGAWKWREGEERDTNEVLGTWQLWCGGDEPGSFDWLHLSNDSAMGLYYRFVGLAYWLLLLLLPLVIFRMHTSTSKQFPTMILLPTSSFKVLHSQENIIFLWIYVHYYKTDYCLPQGFT